MESINCADLFKLSHPSTFGFSESILFIGHANDRSIDCTNCVPIVYPNFVPIAYSHAGAFSFSFRQANVESVKRNTDGAFPSSINFAHAVSVKGSNMARHHQPPQLLE